MRAISLEQPGKSSNNRSRVTDRRGTKTSKSPSLSNDDYSGMEEDADDGGVIDAGNSLFDDAIPELLPIGTQDPSAEEEGAVDAPVRLFVALPSAWIDAVLLLSGHVAKFLRAMFIPPEHRPDVFLRDMKELQANHSMIYMGAAFNYHMRHPYELPKPWMGASRLKREVWRQVGHLTAKHTAVAMTYFRRGREELYQKEFCILKAFVADETVPDEEVSQIDANTLRFFRKLHSAIEKTFPRERALRVGKGISLVGTTSSIRRPFLITRPIVRMVLAGILCQMLRWQSLNKRRTGLGWHAHVLSSKSGSARLWLRWACGTIAMLGWSRCSPPNQEDGGCTRLKTACAKHYTQTFPCWRRMLRATLADRALGFSQ